MSRRAPRIIASQHSTFSPPINSLRFSRNIHLHHRAWRASTRCTNRYPNHRAYSTTKRQFWKIPYLGTLALSLAAYSLIPWNEGWPRKAKNDSARANELAFADAKAAKIEIITPERGTDQGGEQVPTGTSTVPFFPRKIWLPRTGAVNDGKSPTLPAGTGIPDQDEEYQLLGLGIRTVSFLSIQVYVVGLYVAHSDLSKLQEKIVHAVAAPGASTLVQGEKGDLKQLLLEDQGSEDIWSSVLKETGLKSALRIVPTRSTNFGHLRDGWVRTITARSKGPEFTDAGFEPSVGQFKAIFGGRQLQKGKALLLGRAADGSLGAWVEEEEPGTKAIAVGAAATPSQAEGDKSNPARMVWIGGVNDERISRLVWLGYLAGGKVASEGARRSVVDGVMELVERPIGTVETQVV